MAGDGGTYGSLVKKEEANVRWPCSDLAKPIHVQKVEAALRLDPLLSYIEQINKQCLEISNDPTLEAEQKVGHSDPVLHQVKGPSGDHTYNNGTVISKAERQQDKQHLYNFERVDRSRQWLQDVLLSDSSTDDEEDTTEFTERDLSFMLKQHVYQKRCRDVFSKDKELRQYQYMSVGLLCNIDKYDDQRQAYAGSNKRRIMKEKIKLENRIVQQRLQNMIEKERDTTNTDIGEADVDDMKDDSIMTGLKGGKIKNKKLSEEQILSRRRRLWLLIVKKEIPRAQRQKANARREGLLSLRKVGRECQKERRKQAVLSQKQLREGAVRGRRLAREMQLYWKRFERVEKEQRRKAEREALEQHKIDIEFREMKRQQRKLNFLITQTELYAHFMAGKLAGGGGEREREAILGKLEDKGDGSSRRLADGRVVSTGCLDDYDCEEMKEKALINAEQAYLRHQRKNREFDSEMRKTMKAGGLRGEAGFSNPSLGTDVERQQPKIFCGELKTYQLRGMNWLANLYDQGINGILADEMGLGKTVQSIAFLAHLAETQSIWGPFLIIAPASTLHNWQQEVSRFVPRFKVVPYWGNTQDRKVLRKFWSQSKLHLEEASFHVVITSYQLIVTDVKYFQRIKWHYMILDEAQAIKSSTSARWRILLSFSCRNRLLLTGTPIQNSMAELWALLHFIMPTLFDSLDEFSEWFSKDIESHIEKQSNLDENQLDRLHMILKPFMLRRVKRDVENELSDKIEVLVYCPLTHQQKLLYRAIKNKISIEDLLQSALSGRSVHSSATASTSSLMNLVMQLRKVCNHPDLFERRDVQSPVYFQLPTYVIPKLVYREALLEDQIPSKRHLVYNKLYIHHPQHISQSLYHKTTTDNDESSSCFSFTSFIDLSPAQLYNIMFGGLACRWISLLDSLRRSHIIHHRREYQHMRPLSTRYLTRDSMSLSHSAILSPPNLSASPVLRALVFSTHTGCLYTHTSHRLYARAHTPEHRKRLLDDCCVVDSQSSFISTAGANNINTVSGAGSVQTAQADSNSSTEVQPLRTIECLATDMPSFLYYTTPRVYARYMDQYTSDRSAAWRRARDVQCGSTEGKACMWYGVPDGEQQTLEARRFFFPSPRLLEAGLVGLQPRYGFSRVHIPDKETLIRDAGKLYILDELLGRLKQQDHRVLIYSQMTKMIDILEEFLWYRKHSYMRLDGSSKISDRRDMVADFQTRSDIFVFLLSTRAGGLGINLTAADTVIFYDIDWNPTVDQQAMDRAHRLGQTKQVTVYRLVCKGTIEERILQRAKEKNQIQNMVISGGSFSPEILKPKEVVSLLLDDDEMQRKLTQKQEEKRLKEELAREKDRNRKRKSAAADKTPGTSRGVGRPSKSCRQTERDGESGAATLLEDSVSLSAFDESSMISMNSMSQSNPASPLSEVSTYSVTTQRSDCTNTTAVADTDDDYKGGRLVIVDNSAAVSPANGSPSTSTASGARSRGRPKGSGVSVKSRGRDSVRKSLQAAEAAAAQATQNK